VTFKEACKVFAVDPTYATWTQVRDLYRELARTAHPDAGGDRADWDVLQETYATLKRAFSVSPTCQSCHGDGRVLQHVGRRAVIVECDGCHGCGKLPSPVTGETT
jgi:DnaJ-class molecular chaperone